MKRQLNYKAVIFDLDGTLLDTTEGVLRSVDEVIEQLQLPQLEDEIKSTFIGPPIQNSLQQVYNLDPERTKQGANLFRNIYKDKYLYHAKLYPRLIEVLTAIQTMGIKIGVATYKREDYTLQLLDHFGISKYCNSIHGSDFEGKLVKSDIIELCLSDMNIDDYSNVLMVGDTLHDAGGAEKLGIPFVGVTYGFGFRTVEEQQRYQSIAFINSIEELLNYL